MSTRSVLRAEMGEAAAGDRFGCAGVIGGRKPRTLSGDVGVWLRDRLHSARFTTRGLAAELAARGIKTDRRAVWTFVREEGLSFKKKPVRQRAGSARRRAQT